MEFSNTALSLLEHIEQPAFCVRDGVIICANSSAEQRQIFSGIPIAELVVESAPLSSEVQACTITVDGISYNATVSPLNGDHLFLLETDNTQSQLQSLALAAQHFRAPLGGVMALTEMLLSNSSLRDDPTALSQAVQLNRGLNQIQRMVCDMSDTWQYTNLHNIRKEMVEISNVFHEILEKVKTVLEKAQVKLNFTGLDHPLFCLADTQMLERAIYNLISNSVKFSDSGCAIDARLTQCGNMLHFSVSDSGAKIPGSLQATVFSRFLREPGIEGGIFGIGLGMMLIRSVAAAHGGTVLIDSPDGCGNRVTMTLEIDDDNHGHISGPVLRMGDYAGGRDHALLELSDVLPNDLYDPMKY